MDGPAAEDLIVTTSSGTGETLDGVQEAPSIRQFLGIPFAQPPVGELRWMPPRPLNVRNKTVQAKTFGPACPQYISSSPTLYNDLVPEFNINPSPPPSEDCLSLSIWAPSTDRIETESGAKGLPVVMWLHGGGFNKGGTNTKYQYPTRWVERSQSHIVVSIQYRVNIFGFPFARGLKSNNLGILDQRLAIEWVRDNIRGFGGDPARITLWGQSAGAISIDILSFAFPKDPIAQGFILDSGTAFLRRAPPDPTFSNFSAVAAHFGCSTTDGQAELEFMRQVPEGDITKFVGEYADSGKTPALTFNPRPDEEIIFADYAARYARAALASVPAVIGFNDNEGVAFVPFPANPGGTPDLKMAGQVTSMLFQSLARQSAAARRKTGRKTYQYVYRGNFSNISPKKWMGAYHSAEVPLIMGTSGDFRGKNTDLEQRTSEAMQDLWLAFIKDPEKAEGWEEYATGKTLVFAEGGRAVATEHFKHRL